MPIKAVHLSADAYLTCLYHALSTEKQEIMGLLLGHVEENNQHGGESFIESVVILQRSDRQADRVEISPLQLTAAAQKAEKLSIDTGKPIRVLGWYHSHPHITVGPSHVDVRTQSNYQGMDPEFIGLIFSVFQNEKSDKFASVSMICFQSEENDLGHLVCKEIKVYISPTSIASEQCLKTLPQIPKTLRDEELELKERLSCNKDLISEMHNSAAFTQIMCQLLECCEMPLISAISSYEKSLSLKLKERMLLRDELATGRKATG